MNQDKCICIKKIDRPIFTSNVGEKFTFTIYSRRNLDSGIEFNHHLIFDNKNNTVRLHELEFNRHFMEITSWRDKQIEIILEYE